MDFKLILEVLSYWTAMKFKNIDSVSGYTDTL